jgi:hypothetical protein
VLLEDQPRNQRPGSPIPRLTSIGMSKRHTDADPGQVFPRAALRFAVPGVCPAQPPGFAARAVRRAPLGRWGIAGWPLKDRSPLDRGERCWR